jgi:UDP-N-acetylglucosamine 2-epimerase (non-hydrolysing)
MHPESTAMATHRPTEILCVVGARPNFMKAAPLLRALQALPEPPATLLVHTGQHFDEGMSGQFFRDLGIPPPDIDLGVGAGTHAQQTAEIMRRFEPVVVEQRPRCVVVFGDVNSTLACALVSVKLGVPVAHVEAGLRSRDRRMPEEINRILTDQLAARLYTTEASARTNLLAEGIEDARIVFTGNVMIDSLFWGLHRAVPPASTLQRVGAASHLSGAPGGFGVVTMHRPSNVDDVDALRERIAQLNAVGRALPLLFPAHPRTMASLQRHGLLEALDPGAVILLPPLGYFEMLGLVQAARMVLTDSGGLQEETTALGIPCLTLRENTERPITLVSGTNTLVGSDSALLHQRVHEILSTPRQRAVPPEKWDGHAAERIAADLVARLAEADQAVECASC